MKKELWSEELDVPDARADDRHVQRGRDAEHDECSLG